MAPAHRPRPARCRLFGASGIPNAKHIWHYMGNVKVKGGRSEPARSVCKAGGIVMEELDTSQGWCCDGRTWKEHADEGGECCQSEGTQIEALPPDGQQKARERLAQASG